jgi:hypothetical protein
VNGICTACMELTVLYRTRHTHTYTQYRRSLRVMMNLMRRRRRRVHPLREGNGTHPITTSDLAPSEESGLARLRATHLTQAGPVSRRPPFFSPLPVRRRPHTLAEGSTWAFYTQPPSPDVCAIKPASFHDVTPAFHHSIPQYLTASRRASACVPVEACLCLQASIFETNWFQEDARRRRHSREYSVREEAARPIFLASYARKRDRRVLAQVPSHFFHQISSARPSLHYVTNLCITIIHVRDASEPSQQTRQQRRCVV